MKGGNWVQIRDYSLTSYIVCEVKVAKQFLIKAFGENFSGPPG
jgi:hypothetical protein